MNKLRVLRHYPLSLLCVALIWFLCLMLDVPETPLNKVAFIDKWTHLAMYGGTTSVIWWEYLRCHDRLVFWKLFLFAFLGLIVMSGVIELLQAYCFPPRAGEWADWYADFSGIVLAFVVTDLLYRHVKPRFLFGCRK